ncbi:OmpA family protein [Sediminicoccus sp. KRV36]|uniref:OmpA family protein n=1 Tax=Sediminicoccus sp. KRV36 TaxID=3133721 RepID=UPI00200C9DA2|nr:OmpA family protein [Sediminicoccus rosea]UPY35278.1 OmpA family protein [Sediminicoccus rosea]
MHRRTLSLLALLPLLGACANLNRDPAAEPVRVVFFNEDSDTLDAPARAVVQSAAEAAARFSNVRVNVFGYAGPVGGAAFNRALSEERARHVSELLRQYGVPAERVFILGRGEVPFDMAPVESRRVEIRLATP